MEILLIKQLLKYYYFFSLRSSHPIPQPSSQQAICTWRWKTETELEIKKETDNGSRKKELGIDHEREQTKIQRRMIQ